MSVQDVNAQGKTAMPQTLERLDYLDGVRGIASIFVLLCHIACVFLPQFYFYVQADPALRTIWLDTPLNVITNGKFPVQWFFVLSGFLITRKIYSKREQAIVSPVRTYVKLLEVIVPGVLLSAGLMALGGMCHIKAMELAPQLEFAATYNNFPVSLPHVLLNIFVKPFVSGCDYVGPFWTIRYEMLGSILVAMTAWFACNNPRMAKGLYLLMALYFSTVFSSNLVSFMVGALAYDCICRVETDNSVLGRLVNKVLTNRLLCGATLLVGIYCATINLSVTGPWSPFAGLPSAVHAVIRAAGIAMCLACICRIKGLQRLLSARPLRWLGSISAFTYAFHWPIILSLGCGLVILLHGKVNDAVLNGVITASVLLVTIVGAYVYIKAWARVKTSFKNWRLSRKEAA